MVFKKGIENPHSFKKGHKTNIGRKHKIETINYMKNNEHSGWLKKGNIPWNKNLKGEEYKQHYANGFKGIFENGKSPWISGKHQSEESKLKTKMKNLGRAPPNKGKRGLWHPNEEQKRKQREKLIGRVMSPEARMKSRLSQLNKYVSPETREKIKIARSKQIFPIKDTSIEIKIQNFLQQLGIKFFTHQYIKEIPHAYQCDVFIPLFNMIIECDGNYWHNYPIGNEVDHIRTKELTEKGFKVIRLWEQDIKKMTLDKFKEKING